MKLVQAEYFGAIVTCHQNTLKVLVAIVVISIKVFTGVLHEVKLCKLQTEHNVI